MCCVCRENQPALHTKYTQKMQYELTCAECNISFSSAALMLKHFAQHASQGAVAKKAVIPDLYPISSLKAALKHSQRNKSDTPNEENEENIDSGVEDVNPLRYCTVSIEDGSSPESSECNSKSLRYCSVSIEDGPLAEGSEYNSKCASRKYKCTYCAKMFGWSTDLKRHILTHTGERPFKCLLCDSTFTRKFLLQKHQAKQHKDLGCNFVSANIEIPPLKPIGMMLKQKSRKQDKQKIKRKVFNAKNLYQSVGNQFEVVDNLICST